MTFFFSTNFVKSFKKLLRKKAHAGLESLFIEQILKESKERIIFLGTSNINNSSENSLLKKRIKKRSSGKSSGYRAYFYFFANNNSFDFLHIYPKTGRRSQSSVSKDEQKQLLTDYIKCKNEGKMIQVTLNKEEDKIIDFISKETLF